MLNSLLQQSLFFINADGLQHRFAALNASLTQRDGAIAILVVTLKDFMLYCMRPEHVDDESQLLSHQILVPYIQGCLYCDSFCVGSYLLAVLVIFNWIDRRC